MVEEISYVQFPSPPPPSRVSCRYCLNTFESAQGRGIHEATIHKFQRGVDGDCLGRETRRCEDVLRQCGRYRDATSACCGVVLSLRDVGTQRARLSTPHTATVPYRLKSRRILTFLRGFRLLFDGMQVQHFSLQLVD